MNLEHFTSAKTPHARRMGTDRVTSVRGWRVATDGCAFVVAHDPPPDPRVADLVQEAVAPASGRVTITTREELLGWLSRGGPKPVKVCGVMVSPWRLQPILAAAPEGEVRLEGHPHIHRLRLCGPGWAAILMGVDVPDEERRNARSFP